MVSVRERQQPEQDPPGYRLLGRLGRGAQADVMLAVRLADDREFAIKVVRHDDLDRHQPDAIARLRREGRLLQAVESPHVVVVHELLTTATASYLVMDLLVGESLAKECNRRAGIVRIPLPADAAQVAPATPAAPDPAATRVLTPGERERLAPSRSLQPDDVPADLRTKEHTDWVIGIGLQIARGLDHLHAINLVHRDVKPANVMLVDHGTRAVITDFGMAHQEGVSTITHVDHRSGTPHYWSPEQASGGRCTAASDVFSLGATLFDCLTGWSPLHQRPMAPPSTWRLPRLSRLRPDLPRPLIQVLTRALELDPRDRYPDAGALLADLLRCQRQQPIQIPISFGRLWRHHGRALLLLLTVAALAISAFFVRDWVLDRSRVTTLAAAARDRDPGLPRMWHSLPKDRQTDLLPELRQLLADSPDAIRHLACTCGLAAVEIAATDAFQVAVCRVDQAPPSLDTFVRPTAGATLLAHPGYTWLLVVPVHSSLWWSEQDPLCLFHLRELPPAGPTPGPAQAPWHAVRHTIEGLRNWLPADQWLSVPPPASPTIAADRAELIVLRHEMSEGVLAGFLRMHTGQNLNQDELAHNAHPQEPAAALGEALAGAGTATRRSTRPAKADFWAAWRLATSLGAIVPTRNQWERAAAGAVASPTPADPLLPIDAPPGTDVSTCGAHWMRGNATEWLTADTYTTPPCAALPGQNGPGGIVATLPQERHGIRLVRYRIPLHR